jgi:hypothetical protein
MRSILDIVEEPGPDIDAGNAAVHIWLSPISTFRHLLKTGHGPKINLLFFGAAITATLKQFAGFLLNFEDFSAETFMLIGSGTLLVWMGYHAYAWALGWCGRWFNGKAGTNGLRVILAWSLIPSIASIALIVPKLFFFGPSLFSSEKEMLSQDYSWPYAVLGFFDLLLLAWTVVILIKGLMLVHDFGLGKAILTSLLPLVFLSLLLSPLAFVIFDLFSNPL